MSFSDCCDLTRQFALAWAALWQCQPAGVQRNKLTNGSAVCCLVCILCQRLTLVYSGHKVGNHFVFVVLWHCQEHARHAPQVALAQHLQPNDRVTHVLVTQRNLGGSVDSALRHRLVKLAQVFFGKWQATHRERMVSQVLAVHIQHVINRALNTVSTHKEPLLNCRLNQAHGVCKVRLQHQRLFLTLTLLLLLVSLSHDRVGVHPHAGSELQRGVSVHIGKRTGKAISHSVELLCGVLAAHLPRFNVGHDLDNFSLRLGLKRC